MRFVWGIPLGHIHQCFHNFEWGPEGDLYFTCGDPLTSYGDFHDRPDHWGHWTWFSSGGEKIEYNGVGGVFRVRPDGTGFKVVARGLRNPIGLSFDSHWNLFTNDNDHEQLPADYVPGRLIHVTPHAYFSWPRGWMPSKQPHRPDLLETMNDHLGRYVPVGEADYEDSYLPEKYRHSLIVDRWGEHKLVYYPIESRGASFKAEEHDLLLCKGDARPVGVAVGSGGRIFLTVCYMPANDTSPTYRSDVLVIERADKAPAVAGYDITKLQDEQLSSELTSPDWSRAHAAHEDILRREVAGPGSEPWIMAARGETESVLALARQPDPATRLQALRALTNLAPSKSSDDVFLEACGDKDPSIQLAGVLALFDRSGPVPQAIIDGPARSTDTYLRQAATLLIAEKAPLSQIQTLLDSPDTLTRLAGVLAAGSRLTIPPATGPLPQGAPLDARAQAGSYVIANFLDSPKVDLRKLGGVGNFTVAQWWKDLKHTAEHDQLFSMLQSRLADPDTQIRYEAAFYLNLLNDPRVGPRIAQVFHEFEPKSLGPKQAVSEFWAIGPFPDQRRGFNLVHPPEEGPINLAGSYPTARSSLTWKRVAGKNGYFDFDALLARNSDSSDYAYFRMETARTQPMVLWIGSQQQVRIWQDGRIVWDNWAGRPFKENEDRIPLTLQAGSNDFLIRVHTSAHAILGIAYAKRDSRSQHRSSRSARQPASGRAPGAGEKLHGIHRSAARIRQGRLGQAVADGKRRPRPPAFRFAGLQQMPRDHQRRAGRGRAEPRRGGQTLHDSLRRRINPAAQQGGFTALPLHRDSTQERRPLRRPGRQRDRRQARHAPSGHDPQDPQQIRHRRPQAGRPLAHAPGPGENARRAQRFARVHPRRSSGSKLTPQMNADGHK